MDSYTLGRIATITAEKFEKYGKDLEEDLGDIVNTVTLAVLEKQASGEPIRSLDAFISASAYATIVSLGYKRRWRSHAERYFSSFYVTEPPPTISRAEEKRKFITDTVINVGGDMEKAAEFLGVSTDTVGRNIDTDVITTKPKLGRPFKYSVDALLESYTRTGSVKAVAEETGCTPITVRKRLGLVTRRGPRGSGDGGASGAPAAPV